MQATSPTVSIILPVFNGGEHLMPAVMSVIKQSSPDWELIIIDDGSSDDAVTKLHTLSDIRIKIFRDGLNKGLATRLNEAVKLSSGAYIARMDADDLCFPERIATQVRFLDDNPGVDLVSARALAFDSLSADPIGLLPFRENHEALTASPWRGIYMPHPTWMGRASWFRRFPYRIPEVMRAEDQELLLRALPESKYHSLPDILLAYRQNDFNFNKTLLARKHLLRAQLGLFYARGQAGNFFLALFFSMLKISIDMIAAIPGFRWIFFRRMSNPPSAIILEKFTALKNSFRHSDEKN